MTLFPNNHLNNWIFCLNYASSKLHSLTSAIHLTHFPERTLPDEIFYTHRMRLYKGSHHSDSVPSFHWSTLHQLNLFEHLRFCQNMLGTFLSQKCKNYKKYDHKGGDALDFSSMTCRWDNSSIWNTSCLWIHTLIPNLVMVSRLISVWCYPCFWSSS